MNPYFNKLYSYYTVSILLGVMLIMSSCKKDADIIPDNNAPYYNGVPNVQLENYVNRLFIDLIGREPLNVEMDAEVTALREAELSPEARLTLITKLQFDDNYLEGDSSYKHAYFNRLYEATKVRVLEAASNSYILQQIGIVKGKMLNDSLSGDTIELLLGRFQKEKMESIISSEFDYRNGVIEIKDVYAAMVDNRVYDKINMNSFNFVNAVFDNLFVRFPTTEEFDDAFNMVEYEISQKILGVSGQNKGDLINIMLNSSEFYEGLIIWTYNTLLGRDPTTNEVYQLINSFYSDHNLQNVQAKILISDEYANFK